MKKTIEIYNQEVASEKDIRVILFFPIPIKNEIDTIIFAYPNLEFEHIKLIKPFLKENNILRKLDKEIIQEKSIYNYTFALAKIGIATFVNIGSTPNEFRGFITLPKRLTETENKALNLFNPFFISYNNLDANRILLDSTLITINEIHNGKCLINYLAKEKGKILTKGKNNHV